MLPHWTPGPVGLSRKNKLEVTRLLKLNQKKIMTSKALSRLVDDCHIHVIRREKFILLSSPQGGRCMWIEQIQENDINEVCGLKKRKNKNEVYGL